MTGIVALVALGIGAMRNKRSGGVAGEPYISFDDLAEADSDRYAALIESRIKLAPMLGEMELGQAVGVIGAIERVALGRSSVDGLLDALAERGVTFDRSKAVMIVQSHNREGLYPYLRRVER